MGNLAILSQKETNKTAGWDEDVAQCEGPGSNSHYWKNITLKYLKWKDKYEVLRYPENLVTVLHNLSSQKTDNVRTAPKSNKSHPVSSPAETLGNLQLLSLVASVLHHQADKPNSQLEEAMWSWPSLSSWEHPTARVTSQPGSMSDPAEPVEESPSKSCSKGPIHRIMSQTSVKLVLQPQQKELKTHHHLN